MTYFINITWRLTSTSFLCLAYLQKLSFELTCQSFTHLPERSHSLARVLSSSLARASISLLTCKSPIAHLKSFHSSIRLQIQNMRAVQGEGGLCSLLSPCLPLPQIFCLYLFQLFTTGHQVVSYMPPKDTFTNQVALFLQLGAKMWTFG